VSDAIAQPLERVLGRCRRWLEFEAGVRADVDQLFDRLGGSDALPGDIVHLWGVTGRPDGDAAEMSRHTFYSLLHVGGALSAADRRTRTRLTVVTNHAHAVTGTEEVQPLKALVTGPSRIIPAEVPDVQCSHVDVIWPAEDKREHAVLR
jgi:hypothetical protein